MTSFFSHRSSSSGASSSLRAFTLVEMILVLTILSILSVAAMVDYGLSVKKARLQIAMEELIGLFHEAEVFSQSRYVEVTEDPDDEEVVSCWGVVITLGQEPSLVQLPWASAAERCSSDFAGGEISKTLSWHPQLSLDSIEWTTMEASSGTVEGSTEWVGILFLPPQGDREVYLDSTSSSLLENVTSLRFYFSYGQSDDAALTKVVEFSPVTASFSVNPGGASSP